MMSILLCLALNIYHEARGEPLIGQEMVASVTLNRVASPLYPDNVCDVVYQPRQFAWTADPPPVTDTQAFYTALMIAWDAQPINEATHFYSGPAPYWTRHPDFQLVGKIAGHTFYKETRP